MSLKGTRIMDIYKQYIVDKSGFFLEDKFIPVGSTLDILIKEKDNEKVMLFSIPEGKTIEYKYNSNLHEDLVDYRYITHTENCKKAPKAKFELGEFIEVESLDDLKEKHDGIVFDKKYDYLNEKWRYLVLCLGTPELQWEIPNIECGEDLYFEESRLKQTNLVNFAISVSDEETLVIEIEKQKRI